MFRRKIFGVQNGLQNQQNFLCYEVSRSLYYSQHAVTILTYFAGMTFSTTMSNVNPFIKQAFGSTGYGGYDYYTSPTGALKPNTNPVTMKDMWGGIQHAADKQWWNPAGWIAKGYDTAGRGASKYTEGTPFGNVQGNWDSDKMLSGAKDMGLGALQSIGTVYGGGGLTGGVSNLASRGVTRAAQTGAGKAVSNLTGKVTQRVANTGAGRLASRFLPSSVGAAKGKTFVEAAGNMTGTPFVTKALSKLPNVAFNLPAAFKTGTGKAIANYAKVNNPWLYKASKPFRMLERPLRPVLKNVGKWGDVTSEPVLGQLFKSPGKFFKRELIRRPAVLAGSLVSPGNLAMLYAGRSVVKNIEETRENPMSPAGQAATNFVDFAPYAFSRSTANYAWPAIQMLNSKFFGTPRAREAIFEGRQTPDNPFLFAPFHEFVSNRFMSNPAYTGDMIDQLRANNPTSLDGLTPLELRNLRTNMRNMEPALGYKTPHGIRFSNATVGELFPDAPPEIADIPASTYYKMRVGAYR